MSRRKEMTSNIAFSCSPKRRTRAGEKAAPSTSATNMPAPARLTSSDLSCNSETASRREGRDTPRRSESSRSAGSRSPGRRMPSRMRSSIWRTTLRESFSGWTFSNGKGCDLGTFESEDTAGAGAGQQKRETARPGAGRLGNSGRFSGSAVRTDRDLDPTVGLTTFRRAIRRDGLVVARPERADPRAADAARTQDRRDGACPAKREVAVVFERTHAVGMSHHLDGRVGVLVEALGEGGEVVAQVRPHAVAVEVEGDVVRHPDDEFVTGVDDVDFLVEGAAKFTRLPVEIGPDGCTDAGADSRADESAVRLRAALVEREAGDRPGECAADGPLARVAVGVRRVEGFGLAGRESDQRHRPEGHACLEFHGSLHPLFSGHVSAGGIYGRIPCYAMTAPAGTAKTCRSGARFPVSRLTRSREKRRVLPGR